VELEFPMQWIGTAALIAAFLGMASAGQSGATEPAAVSHETENMPQVTIEAQRRSLQPRVHTFVYDITARVDSVDSLSRWNQPICPLVAGLPLEQGEAVLTRLSQIVSAAGAKLAPQKCDDPNFYVVVTSEPQRVLKKWRARAPFMFGPVPPRDGKQSIEQFIHSERPIRVWYTTELVDYYHAPAGTTDFDLGQDFGGAPSIMVWTDPRLTWPALLMLHSVIIVVDEKRVKGYTLGQLTDYVGMIGLTQINLDSAQQVGPSILHLFAAASPAGDRPGGLSSWDQAFLKGLYSTEQGSRWQRSAIVTQVVRELVQPEPTPVSFPHSP
jgi:hypothetical protein